jgi:hypothetical protein
MRMDIQLEIVKQSKYYRLQRVFVLQTYAYFEGMLFFHMNVSDASTCFLELIWNTRTDSEFLVRGFRHNHHTEISGGLIQQNNVCSHLS